jgi:pyruvate dehydrogenase E2 component (dihydrolipoyllysine-residue acetyltransferase)
MLHEIVMPQLGLTMTEGSVNTWLKQSGDLIEKGDLLFTVSTDKVDMDVESTGRGFLSATIDPGITVPVGTVIAVLMDRPGEKGTITPGKSQRRDDDVQQPEPAPHRAAVDDMAKTQASGSFPQPPKNTGDGSRYPASPRARAVAKSLGIEITEITPQTGTRIVEEDVRRVHASREKVKPEPPSALKRITAERTTESFQRAPHFYLGAEVNASRLAQLREELAEIAQRRLGFKLTYTDFMLKALSMALREEPEVNAYWDAGSIVRRNSIDVGFAAQTETGLMVPVIPGSAAMSLFQLASRRHDLADRARAGTLRLEELQGGSATLSNLGAHGVSWFQAILNPPQSVILAAGAITKRPMVVNDHVEACHSLTLTLSADHRVLDGVAAARFLGVIQRTLADPHELLV